MVYRVWEGSFEDPVVSSCQVDQLHICLQDQEQYTAYEAMVLSVLAQGGLVQMATINSNTSESDGGYISNSPQAASQEAKHASCISKTANVCAEDHHKVSQCYSCGMIRGMQVNLTIHISVVNWNE